MRMCRITDFRRFDEVMRGKKCIFDARGELRVFYHKEYRGGTPTHYQLWGQDDEYPPSLFAPE